VVLAARRRRVILSRVACLWVALYLSAGIVQRDRAEEAGLAMARARGHSPVAVDAKPAFASLLLWKTIYAHGGRYYVDAVRVGAAPVHFPGQSAASLVLSRDLPWLEEGTQQARDIERFRWFSDGYLALHPRDPLEVIDVRYSMLPDRIDPLWGIRLDPAAPPDAFVRFVTQRRLGPAERQRMLDLLFSQ